MVTVHPVAQAARANEKYGMCTCTSAFSEGYRDANKKIESVRICGNAFRLCVESVWMLGYVSDF